MNEQMRLWEPDESRAELQLEKCGPGSFTITVFSINDKLNITLTEYFTLEIE